VTLWLSATPALHSPITRPQAQHGRTCASSWQPLATLASAAHLERARERVEQDALASGLPQVHSQVAEEHCGVGADGGLLIHLCAHVCVHICVCVHAHSCAYAWGAQHEPLARCPSPHTSSSDSMLSMAPPSANAPPPQAGPARLQLRQVLEHAIAQRLLRHARPQREHALQCQLPDVRVAVHKARLRQRQQEWGRAGAMGAGCAGRTLAYPAA